MGYFDHISCHACKANIDPDRIKPVEGRLICPFCNTELKMMDLFGIKASFSEDDQPDLTLDQLVPGDSGHLANPWGQPEGGHTMNHGRWEPDIPDDGGIHTGRPQSPPRGQGGGKREQFRGTGIPEGAQVARHIEPPPSARQQRGGPAGGRPSQGSAPRSHQIEDQGGVAPNRGQSAAPSRPAPRRPTSRDSAESGGPTSALDALRKLKGKK